MEYYKTITARGTAEFKDKGSRFIAIAEPIDSPEAFKVLLAEIKKEHPKANHHCFAWRLGFDGNLFRLSDDGEPSGSAGRPILGQIDSKELINTAVVVVRYFGGTLLGVPGLINAYKTATTLALQVTPILEKPVEAAYKVHCSYPLLNDVMTLLKQSNCSIGAIEQSLFCVVHTGIAKTRQEQVLQRLRDIYGVEVFEDKK
jgi:uncharacterized YigZ family protein